MSLHTARCLIWRSPLAHQRAGGSSFLTEVGDFSVVVTQKTSASPQEVQKYRLQKGVIQPNLTGRAKSSFPGCSSKLRETRESRPRRPTLGYNRGGLYWRFELLEDLSFSGHWISEGKVTQVRVGLDTCWGQRSRSAFNEGRTLHIVRFVGYSCILRK